MKAFVKRITDSHIEVRCGNCRTINPFTRQSTDEGKYKKRCYKCNMKMTFEVDKHKIFRDLGGGGKWQDQRSKV